MKKSKSSSQWLKEHDTDEYVLRARRDGWRSRASYKLMELDEKDKLFSRGMTVVDLGAAPGGWTQVAAARAPGGRIIASDILSMNPVAETVFIQGDFTSQEVFEQILDAMNHEKADMVMSDMAPNLSGVRTADQARAIYLVELALDLATRTLKPDGTFLVKVFQGAGAENYIKDVRSHFKSVAIRKPAASRPRSREVYLLARSPRAL